MKPLVALVLLAGCASLAALALAVTGSRDPVPGALKDCLRERGVRIARGPEGLGAVRDDVVGGTLRRGEVVAAGDDEAVVLAGRGARMLVLATPDTEGLDAPDLPVRAYTDPTRFSVVAVEADPLRGVLETCVRRAAAA